MKRIIKTQDSDIVVNKLSYANQKDRPRITEILIKEQHHYCAYTEARIAATYSIDIDHFNPQLKNTNKDGYNNWYAVSTCWNRKKNENWQNYQPLIYPTDEKLEERLLYDDGYYFPANPNDLEVKNLIELLQLNNERLIDDRKKYINRLRFIFDELGAKKLQEYLSKNPEGCQYRRAIEHDFILYFD